MKVIFNAMLAAVIVGILVTSTSAGTTVYALNHKIGSDSSTDNSPKGSDTGSSSSDSSRGSGSSGSQSSGSDSSGGQSSGISGSGPNPSGPPPPAPGQPPQSLTACPNGGQPDSSGKCPSIPPPPIEKCPGGALPDKNGNCPLTICPKGEVYINGNCIKRPPCIDICPPPPLPKNCHKVDNSSVIICREGGGTKVIHSTTIQQVPVTGTNDINLFIVTTCTADQNNGVLSGNLSALCDSTITMMHNDGLDAQLPQVDMYLKARGLLS